MTGDNSQVSHNEPQAMREYALDRGVPDEDIVLDYAGRRTYDSCYRARHIFQVERPSSSPRPTIWTGLFTADGWGCRSAAWRRIGASTALSPATGGAGAGHGDGLDRVRITRPEPILGEPLPIFPEAQAPGVAGGQAAG